MVLARLIVFLLSIWIVSFLYLMALHVSSSTPDVEAHSCLAGMLNGDGNTWALFADKARKASWLGAIVVLATLGACAETVVPPHDLYNCHPQCSLHVTPLARFNSSVWLRGSSDGGHGVFRCLSSCICCDHAPANGQGCRAINRGGKFEGSGDWGEQGGEALMPKGPKGKSPKESFYHVDRVRTKPKRKKLNAVQRRELKAAALQLFVKRVGRQVQRGVEPNDRKHSRDVEKAADQMAPEEFYELTADEADEQ
jgi:hypothetical protein